MFKNYLKIAFRNLLRYKIYSMINISGLTIGMACSVLILLFVKDELSYDTFHDNADRIYRLTRTEKLGDKTFAVANTASAMGPTMQQDYSAVEKVVRFWRLRSDVMLRFEEKKFHEHGFYFADGAVFDVFTFPLKSGDPRKALKDPYTMVITEEMAEKYFGDADPIGKVISLDNSLDFKVTGVLHKIPRNSHFNFNFLASMASFEELAPHYFRNLGVWFNKGFYTYLLLQENTDISGLENQFPAFVEKYMAESFSVVTNSSYEVDLNLEPLTDIYLRSNLQSQLEPVSDMRYVYIFSGIAFIILLIACINFMNLATARSTRRAREVGVRKVLGAFRPQLITQFVCESTFLSIIALSLALGMVDVLLPFFNNLAGKALTMGYFSNTFTGIATIGIALFVGLLAGSYPSFFLSAFHPVKVLSGLSKSGSPSQPLLRKALVVFQFAVSIALIVCTAIISNQLNFIQNKKLGFDKEQLVVMPIKSGNMRRSYETIKSELLQYPNLLGVTAASGLPGQRLPADSYPVFLEGKDGENWVIQTTMVDHDFVETMGIKLTAGRDFSKEFPTDASSGFILNETAVKALGWDEPLGKKITWEGDGPNGKKEGQVIAVVEDYHYQSLHQIIEPLILHIKPNRFSTIAVRIQAANVTETLAFLKDTWSKFDPQNAFEYSFLDEDLTNKYRSEIKLGKIFTYFSSLAIFIACLGLFGLASFTAEQRTKEVGIRKVLGATVANVTSLLSKDFIKLVLLANLIAWPIAWNVMNLWLEDFAYRTHIGWWVFVMSGGLALVITLLTVSWQAIKVAIANPVKSLRYE